MSSSRKKWRSGRAGFTLVEILLVLALVVIIAAVAWPTMQRPIANRRLYVAADLVRSGVYQARNDAIRSGRVFVFRYVPDGDRFCIQPQDDPSATTEAMVTGQDDAVAATDEDLLPVEKMLPEGVKFVGGEASSDAAVAALDPVAEAPPDSDCSWSDPILFYPDGTTSDAHLVLGNEWGRAMEVTLRGVTGTVTTGDVASTE